MPVQPIEIAQPYTYDVEFPNRFRRITSNPHGAEYTNHPEIEQENK